MIRTLWRTYQKYIFIFFGCVLLVIFGWKHSTMDVASADWKAVGLEIGHSNYTSSGSKTSEKITQVKKSKSKSKQKTAIQPISMNRATLEQWDSLPGIGPKRAQDILILRNKKGKFTKINDLLDVKGIGPKSMEKLKLLLLLP